MDVLNQSSAGGVTIKSLVADKVFIAAAAVIVLFVFGEVIAPGFLGFNHVMSIVRLASFLGIVALGQTLVVLSGGDGIDLSVGSVLSLGVVVASSILNGKSGNLGLAIVVVLAVGFAIGLVSGIGVATLEYRPS